MRRFWTRGSRLATRWSIWSSGKVTGSKEMLVRLRSDLTGYDDPDDNTWEPADNLREAKAVIDKFEKVG